jgi:hypothetical protein
MASCRLQGTTEPGLRSISMLYNFDRSIAYISRVVHIRGIGLKDVSTQSLILKREKLSQRCATFRLCFVLATSSIPSLSWSSGRSRSIFSLSSIARSSKSSRISSRST